MKSGCRIEKPYFTVSTPSDTHLGNHVDEINFAVENIDPAGTKLHVVTDFGNVIRNKRMPSCSELVKNLTVTEEKRFLDLSGTRRPGHNKGSVVLLQGMR